jgi:hypothetical protein
MYLLAKPLNLAETAATMGKSLRGELSEWTFEGVKFLYFACPLAGVRS